MTVTKQQQLERISRIIPKWNDAYLYAELMTNPSINMTVYRFTDNPSGDNVFITREEWQQERDKMSRKPEVDNSWHERGEFPPAGVVCEVLNNELYNPEWEKCTIIFMGQYKCIYSSETRSEIVGNVGSAGAIEFRPLSTEREKAIDELSKCVENAAFYCCGTISNSQIRVIAERLYDDGVKR